MNVVNADIHVRGWRECGARVKERANALGATKWEPAGQAYYIPIDDIYVVPMRYFVPSTTAPNLITAARWRNKWTFASAAENAP